MFQPGEEVLVTGYDLGMNTPGGYGAYIRVPSRWVVKRPDGLTLRDAMILGTAGFTAAQSVYYLREHGVEPDSGDVLVTGATGGVGSLAVSILGRLGYSVTAATGKLQEAGFLKSLGATDVISREDVTDTSGKPLLKGRWAGVVDTVGGTILSTAIRSVRHRGTVTCCGLVASPELSVTVFPFILRGVRLLGVDSAECPYDLRLKIWRLLSGEWKPNTLEQLCIEITWAELDEWIAKILNGAIRGRVIVKPISGVD
jgi:putative YhdH/YhfP family quinone oxidoreductase